MNLILRMRIIVVIHLELICDFLVTEVSQFTPLYFLLLSKYPAFVLRLETSTLKPNFLIRVSMCFFHLVFVFLPFTSKFITPFRMFSFLSLLNTSSYLPSATFNNFFDKYTNIYVFHLCLFCPLASLHTVPLFSQTPWFTSIVQHCQSYRNLITFFFIVNENLFPFITSPYS